jgi:uncharacterized phage-associated protein
MFGLRVPWFGAHNQVRRHAMATITASNLARYILSYFHEKGSPINSLKLQKLIYYGQAWSLALYDKPIFTEPVEAWVHGPVIYSVF